MPQLKERVPARVDGRPAGQRTGSQRARGRGGLPGRAVPQPRPLAHRVLLARGGARSAIDAGPHAAVSAPAPLPNEASQQVLGMSFEELGIGVARAWGLPDGLQQCMRIPEGEPPMRRLECGAERPRWLARGCQRSRRSGAAGRRAGDAARGRAWPSAMRARWAWARRTCWQAVRRHASKLARAGRCHRPEVPQDSPAQRLMDRPRPTRRRCTASRRRRTDAATLAMPPRNRCLPSAAGGGDVLTAGIQDITHAMVAGASGSTKCCA